MSLELQRAEWKPDQRGTTFLRLAHPNTIHVKDTRPALGAAAACSVTDCKACTTPWPRTAALDLVQTTAAAASRHDTAWLPVGVGFSGCRSAAMPADGLTKNSSSAQRALIVFLSTNFESGTQRFEAGKRMTVLSIKPHASKWKVPANPRHLLNTMSSCSPNLKCLSLLWRSSQTLRVSRKRSSPVTCLMSSLSLPTLHSLPQPFWTSKLRS